MGGHKGEILNHPKLSEIESPRAAKHHFYTQNLILHVIVVLTSSGGFIFTDFGTKIVRGGVGGRYGGVTRGNFGVVEMRAGDVRF